MYTYNLYDLFDFCRLYCFNTFLLGATLSPRPGRFLFDGCFPSIKASGASFEFSFGADADVDWVWNYNNFQNGSRKSVMVSIKILNTCAFLSSLLLCRSVSCAKVHMCPKRHRPFRWFQQIFRPFIICTLSLVGTYTFRALCTSR